MMPLISIIVPVYNSAQTIRKCVTSLLAQTYANVEILLIDDGSKDESLSICRQLSSDSPIIRVIHKENGGVSETRNTGIQEARGEWICFVDSDDYVDPTYLSDFRIDEELGPKTLYLQGYQHNYEDGSPSQNVNEDSKLYHLPTDAKSLLENTDLVNFGTVCSKLYNRDILLENDILFNKKMRLNEDNCFFWKYLTIISLVQVSSECGYHYVHAESLNHSKSHKTYEEYLYIMEQNKQNLLNLYERYEVRQGDKFKKNYCQYVSTIWLHALISFFIDNKGDVNIYNNRLLVHKSELTHYSGRNMPLKMFKIFLYAVFKLPVKLQMKVISMFAKVIVSRNLYYV